MIDVQQLVKRYGPHLAVDRISFQVPQGQVVGFLGPNGAGKTTTIRILTGYMPATAGRATVNGYDVLSQSLEVRRHLGYLPESSPLYPEMRASEQLHYFGRLHAMPRRLRVERIAALTDRCGLAKVVHRPIGQLSKGNRQRVALAQALMHDPPVLILDEPTAGLDPVQISEIRRLIVELGEAKTVLFSTHILPEAEMTCSRLIIIANGRIVADDTPEHMLERLRAGAAVMLEIKAEPGLAQQVFKAVPEIRSVKCRTRGEWTHLLLQPLKTEMDIRAIVGQQCRQQGWQVRELRHDTATLEEFFVRATAQPAPVTDTADPDASSNQEARVT